MAGEESHAIELILYAKWDSSHSKKQKRCAQNDTDRVSSI